MEPLSLFVGLSVSPIIGLGIMVTIFALKDAITEYIEVRK